LSPGVLALKAGSAVCQKITARAAGPLASNSPTAHVIVRFLTMGYIYAFLCRLANQQSNLQRKKVRATMGSVLAL
jgi:hypothetical protein